MGDGAVLEQLERPLLALDAPEAPRPIIGTWTFSTAFRVGMRWWNWKTKPTVAARYSDGSRSDSSRSPPTTIDPASALSSAPTRFRSVLLPPPDGPVSETKSPAARRKDTSWRARMRPSSNDL